MRRGQVLLVGALVLALSAGCSGASAPKKSSCAFGLTASADGSTITLTNCAGAVGVAGPLPSLSVRPGQTIKVKGLVSPGYADPSTSESSVVTLVRAMQSAAELKALAPGVATISLSTLYCAPGRRRDPCPAFIVTVAGR